MKNFYLKKNKNYDKNIQKNKKITENLNILKVKTKDLLKALLQ